MAPVLVRFLALCPWKTLEGRQARAGLLRPLVAEQVDEPPHATTREAGRFRVFDVVTGTYDLEVRVRGYSRYRERIGLIEGRRASRELHLRPPRFHRPVVDLVAPVEELIEIGVP